MLRGDDIWCQGFSEPDAGSDLASLRTHRGARRRRLRRQRAEDVEHARPPRELVRAARAHRPRRAEARGISCLLVDMTLPGVEVRPLVTITGEQRVQRDLLHRRARARRRDARPGQRGLARRDDDARLRARHRRQPAPRDCGARSAASSTTRDDAARRRPRRDRRPGAAPDGWPASTSRASC